MAPQLIKSALQLAAQVATLDVYWDMTCGKHDNSPVIKIQAHSQSEVDRILNHLTPDGDGWDEDFDQDLNWWEYKSVLFGIDVLVYACREAPRGTRSQVA